MKRELRETIRKNIHEILSESLDQTTHILEEEMFIAKLPNKKIQKDISDLYDLLYMANELATECTGQIEDELNNERFNEKSEAIQQEKRYLKSLLKSLERIWMSLDKYFAPLQRYIEKDKGPRGAMKRFMDKRPWMR